MKLQTYMNKNKLNDSQVASDIEVKPNSVYRYRTKRQRPDDKVMVRLYVYTDGKVSPNDFYNLPDLHESGGVIKD